MNIRDATIADYEPVMELYNLFVKEKRFKNADDDSFNEVIHEASAYLWVAEFENEIIGFIAFSVRSVVRKPRPILEVDELFVNPLHRRKGVAKKFFINMEKLAKQNNYYMISIESDLDRKDAHVFYESMGYEKAGYSFKKVLKKA